MERWNNKVAVVTGASAGIGAAVVRDLIKANLIVVGLARRPERMQELSNSLPKNLQSKFHPVKCDVSNEKDVKNAFQWINKNLGGVDILINNAGIIQADNTGLVGYKTAESVKSVIDINVLGVIYCTKEAFDSMKSRNVDGHIVLLNSIVGHKVINYNTSLDSFNPGIYPASKFAVTALTESYRQEFIKAGSKTKITSISPGCVQTEIFLENSEAFKDIPILQSEDISQAIMYALGTPPHVQVHELTIKPVGEQF